jgi:predicted dehydrogenase
MIPAVERVGVIGAGGAARIHLQALRRTDGIRVVGILDLDPGRAAALAAEFGLPCELANPARFYHEGRPQSVHIVTPPDAHEDLAAEALDRGLHVLVEKPPALTAAGCRALLRQAGARRLTVGVNENTAMHPLIRQARAAIAAGQLGRLLHIDGFYSFGIRDDQAPPPWMAQLPGGMLEDLLPHLLTTARALAGVPLTPEHWHLAATGRVPGQHHDELRLFLTGAHGLTASLALSLSTLPKAFALAVRGTDATLSIDLRNMLLHLSRPGSRGGAIAQGAELARSAFGALYQTAANAAGLIGGYREGPGSFLHLIRAHYAALEAGAELPAPLSRAAETVQTIRTIWPLRRKESTVVPPLSQLAR